jgi:hypothetical protein
MIDRDAVLTGCPIAPLALKSACAGRHMDEGSKDYRRLAAECRRLAATAADAMSYGEYVALADRWSDLADEIERRTGGFDARPGTSISSTLP